MGGRRRKTRRESFRALQGRRCKVSSAHKLNCNLLIANLNTCWKAESGDNGRLLAALNVVVVVRNGRRAEPEQVEQAGQLRALQCLQCSPLWVHPALAATRLVDCLDLLQQLQVGGETNRTNSATTSNANRCACPVRGVGQVGAQQASASASASAGKHQHQHQQQDEAAKGRNSTPNNFQTLNCCS